MSSSSKKSVENPTASPRHPTSHNRVDAYTPAALTFLVLAFAACGMACLLALLPAAGHDQMWLLYAARMVLHGTPLYGPELFETNPPLIIWLSLVPAGLSSLTHIPDTALGKFFVVAILIFIAWFCLRLLKTIRPSLTQGTLYALAFAYIAIFAVMPARDLGQRDHFLILFILPYIFAAAVRAEDIAIPRWQGWLIGILALAGVVLKPHQLLVPVAVETTLLLIRRRKTGRLSLRQILRPEIFAMLISGIVFLDAVRIFAPLYFSVILPIARATYWAYGQLNLTQLLVASIQLHLLIVIDLILLFVTGWRRASSLIWLLLAAGLASTVAFYIQGTGWYYQQLPALSLPALALIFLLLDLAERHNVTCPQWAPKAATGLGLLALALTTHFMNYPFTAERSFPIDVPDPGFFAGLAPGTPVMTLSPTVDETIQPIFKYHLTLGERYPAFLMLPALLRTENPQGGPVVNRIPAGRLAELDRIQRAYILEDIARWQPRLILVERCQDPAVHCQVLEDRHDDLLAFFLRDPAFAAVWQSYSFSATRGQFDAYIRKQ